MNQKEALKILEQGDNVFLTGPPGSGKTFLLRKFISKLRSQDVNVAITASTGIAATHLEGRTIHSWSGVGIDKELTGEQMSNILENPKVRDRIMDAEVLVIDEISMLNPQQFGLVDLICRRARNNSAPFGGLQVILSGDFFQLPPVQSDEFVTDTETWDALNLNICYLDEQYRQVDEKLTGILKDIRKQNVDSNTTELLESRLQNESNFKMDPTRLYTHNKDVDQINSWELNKLEGSKEEFETKEKGSEGLIKSLKRSSIIPEKLELKKGAIVMFIKNNFEKNYVNGTLGELVDFGAYGRPIVETAKGDRVEVDRSKWSLEEKGSVRAQIKQVPLRLAWAITVHKSQGMTLDAAEIDLSQAFEEGMGYVALSRVKSLKGLSLKGFNEKALQVSEKAIELDQEFKKRGK